MSDDQPAVEPIALAFTRPPMLLGVRYEIFALNGMVTVILFIMTSNFLSVLGDSLFVSNGILFRYESGRYKGQERCKPEHRVEDLVSSCLPSNS